MTVFVDCCNSGRGCFATKVMQFNLIVKV